MIDAFAYNRVDRSAIHGRADKPKFEIFVRWKGHTDSPNESPILPVCSRKVDPSRGFRLPESLPCSSHAARISRFYPVYLTWPSP